MLRYLGLGNRFLGERPMPPHKRLNWEFLAVVRGKLAPFDRNDAPRTLRSERLWLFPPGVVHGWAGVPGESCEVIVIHFSTVPAALEKIARARGSLETTLAKRDKEQLVGIAQRLKRHYWRPTLESEIHCERALMDLSLLVLRDYKERREPQSIGGSFDKVTTAEDWLRDHLAENPALSDAARVIGVSTSQLNRLFRQVRRENPQAVLNRLKIERAMELLGSSNAKLETVAAECGFSSGSNLCRAFKMCKGHSPTRWRKEMFIQYKVPSEAAMGDHTQHGRRARPVL